MRRVYCNVFAELLTGAGRSCSSYLSQARHGVWAHRGFRTLSSPSVKRMPLIPKANASFSTSVATAGQQAASYVKLNLPGDALDGACIDALYLRDSCDCSYCVDTSTRQKLFETSSLPLKLTARSTEWLSDGSLQVHWENDMRGFEDHRSVFPRSFLEQSQSLKKRRQASFNSWEPVAWDRTILEKTLHALSFQFLDYMQRDDVLQGLVTALHVYGLAFIQGVPSDQLSIRRMGQRIGPLKSTFYGETWDVKARPSPINVAYTADDLDFHMDLLYMVDPPSVQLLHCIKQSTSGGESRFSDGVCAFDRLQQESPELVQALVGFPVTYRYKNDGHWFQQTRHFIEGGTSNRIGNRRPPDTVRYDYPTDYETMNWAPPFHGPLEQVDLGGADRGSISIGEYVEAANAFKRLLADESAVFQTKLEEGTCVIFNNRRVLHARRPFSSEGGERWLRGCYIDGDYLRDKFRVLSQSSS